MKMNLKVFFSSMVMILALSEFTSCKPVKKEEKKAEASNQPSIEEAIKQEQKLVTDYHSIPVQYRVKSANGGTIQHIEYKSKKYFGDGSENIKKANVYLPAGYEEGKAAGKKYGVLYLMHGIGGSENEWGMTDDNSLVKKLMDNLISKGDIEPFIVITPNGKSGYNPEHPDQSIQAFYKFGEELRNDLIPYMDANYATYADREGRAMAGLSMGGMQTINIGICECLDLFSWYGAFSAAPTSYDVARVAAYVDSHPEFKINYFYNICGKEDRIAYQSHANAARLLTKLSPAFVDGENYTWHEQMGGHDFGIWNVGFYEFAKIFGSRSK